MPQARRRHRQQAPDRRDLGIWASDASSTYLGNQELYPNSVPSGHGALPRDLGIWGPGPSPPPHRLTPVALSTGHTPLHVAVIHKDAEMVRLLREAGADLNKPVSPSPGEEVWRGGSAPRAGRGLPDLSPAPRRSPRVAGAPCTWQWRPRQPMYWSFS